MGALNCVAGPLTHCCVPPYNPDYYQDFPFYNGPCPPCKCESSGCGGHRCKKHCNCGSCNHGNHCGHCNHGNHCGSCGCHHTRCFAAMFSADAPLDVAAGEAIPLSAMRLNPDCFELCGGCVRILKSGLYHVVWTLNVPSYQTFSGRLYLTLNGSEIAGSGQTICCQADNTSTSATGQAMVQTGPGGLLCLNTGCDLSIGNGCGVENVVTLTITRVN